MLAFKFYVPYTILNFIGNVAYKLLLLVHLKILLIFHMSCLKKVVGPNYILQIILQKIDEEGYIWLQHNVVLDK